MKQTRKLHITLMTSILLSLLLLAGCGASDNATGPAAENLAKGKAFMEQNANQDGVISLDNGIQYRVVTAGTGKNPRLTDTIIIHSRGKHLDGTVFSDSYAEGKPEEVLLKHTILGWKKVLPLMSVGSKWIAYLPPHMAFSSRGVEGVIEPNETIIYELELIDIKW